jgi:hypothetical protein
MSLLLHSEHTIGVASLWPPREIRSMAVESSSGGCRFDKDMVDFLSIEAQSGGGAKRRGAAAVLRREAAAVGFQVPRNESNIRPRGVKQSRWGDVYCERAVIMV